MKARVTLLLAGTVLLGVSAVSLWRKSQASAQISARSGWYFLPQPTAFDRLTFLAGTLLVLAGLGALVFHLLKQAWRKSS
jgi:hypothetical protein